MQRDKNTFIASNKLGGDEAMLISKTADMLRISEKCRTTKFSRFLSAGEAVLAVRFLEYAGAGNYMLRGGFEGAERTVLCVYPEYMEPSEEDFPIKAVRFDSRAAEGLSHRDYLGSLMALGIERNLIGDIITDEGGAYAMLSPDAAELAARVITKIGRAGVKVRFCAEDEVISREDKFTEIRGTAASPRLDCILSAALRVSREKAAALIRSGAVSVDHGVTESVSEKVAEGAVLSVRGYGRYIVEEIGGSTKKDRIHVTIKKYV